MGFSTVEGYNLAPVGFRAMGNNLIKEIFLKRWVVTANAILLVYSIATTFRDAFSPEIQEKYQLNLLLHHLSWQTWVAIFAVGNFLVVLYGAKLAIRKRDDRGELLAGELEEIKSTKPRIKLKEPNAIYCESVDHNFRDQQSKVFFSQTVPFLKIRFENDPIFPSASAIAKDVRAKISFYRCDDESCVLSIDGRWAESTQPPALHPLESRTQLLGATFAIGEERSVDIAYRDKRTKRYFAWNNDNYNYDMFLCPRHLLDGKRFRVEVRLRGVLVDEKISFIFSTVESGFNIEHASIVSTREVR
jgi:hypothetical protein